MVLTAVLSPKRKFERGAKFPSNILFDLIFFILWRNRRQEAMAAAESLHWTPVRLFWSYQTEALGEKIASTVRIGPGPPFKSLHHLPLPNTGLSALIRRRWDKTRLQWAERKKPWLPTVKQMKTLILTCAWRPKIHRSRAERDETPLLAVLRGPLLWREDGVLFWG